MNLSNMCDLVVLHTDVLTIAWTGDDPPEIHSEDSTLTDFNWLLCPQLAILFNITFVTNNNNISRHRWDFISCTSGRRFSVFSVNPDRNFFGKIR